MSKADMLKKKASGTSRGLFQGMEPLKKETKAAENKKEVKKVKEDLTDAAQKPEKEIEEKTVAKVEKTADKQETVIATDIKTQTNESMESEEASTQVIEQDTAVSEDAAKEIDAEVENEVSTVDAANSTEISSVTEETSSTKLSQESVSQPVKVEVSMPAQQTEPEISQVNETQPVYDQNVQQMNPYIEQDVNPKQAVNNAMNQPYVAQYQRPVQEYAQSVQQPVQQPYMNQVQQPAVQSGPIQQMPQMDYSYQMQPQQYQQGYNQQLANLQQQIAAEAAKARTSTRGAGKTAEKASRYEKDKFLLLDIRGLRDYVEHMAKASNLSATKYIRGLIEQDMAQNQDIYLMHKQLEEQLKQRR